MFSKKDIIRLLIPLIIEQTLSVVIGITDIFMVSFLGDAAVSGVSNVDTLNILLLQVLAAISTGGAIVCAQYLGRSEEDDKANAAARQLLLIITAFSMAIMVVCMIGNASLLHLIYPHAAPDVASYSNIYFMLSAISFPLMAIYNIGAALFRIQGNSKISMYAAFLMNIVNVVFNWLFIFAMNLGVAGAALGSLFARAAGAALLFFLLRKHEGRIHLRNLREVRLDFPMVKSILHLSIPNGVENLIFQVGKLIVQGIVNSFGTVATAAHAVANVTMTVGYMPGNAICMGIITVIGQCAGAQEFGQAESYLRKFTRISYLMMSGTNMIIMIALNPLIAFFGLSPQAAKMAWLSCMICCICSMAFWSSAFCIPSGLRASSDVKFTMVVSILTMWIFRVGCSILLGRVLGLGLAGVWISMGLDWAVRGLVYQIRFRSGRWKKKLAL